MNTPNYFMFAFCHNDKLSYLATTMLENLQREKIQNLKELLVLLSAPATPPSMKQSYSKDMSRSV